MGWLRSRLGPGETYDVACACGHPVRGARQQQSQALTCPLCGRLVFVLARSPFVAAERNGHDAAKKRRGPRRAGRPWVMPAVVSVVMLALLVAGFVWLVPQFARRPADTVQTINPDEFRQHLEAGRQAIIEARFERALTELNSAARLRDTHPSVLSAIESRQLTLLIRQVQLLSLLSSRSLQDIVQEAVPVRDEEEWRQRFNRDYRGKAVLFDDVIKRDVAGRPVLSTYVLRVGDDRVRVALEDLEVLRPLALHTPQRLLFGGQLAAVQREPGGGWVIHLVPESGALITDTAVARACYPGALDDELLGLLQRQADWLK